MDIWRIVRQHVRGVNELDRARDLVADRVAAVRSVPLLGSVDTLLDPPGRECPGDRHGGCDSVAQRLFRLLLAEKRRR